MQRTPLAWFLSVVALLLGVAATIPLGLPESMQAIFYGGATLLGTWGVTPAVVSPALAAKFKAISQLIVAFLAASAAHILLRIPSTNHTLALVAAVGLKVIGIAGTILAALGQGAAVHAHPVAAGKSETTPLDRPPPAAPKG